MSTDFEGMLAALDTDADRMLLPAPDQLRAAGDARTHRRVITVMSVVVIVVAVLAGAGLAVAGIRRPSQPGEGATFAPPTASQPAPAGTTPAPTPARTTPSPTHSPTPPGHAAGAPCTSADLVFVGESSSGAMGSIGMVFTVRNRGEVSCRLSAVPTMHYVRANGSTGQVPVESTGSGQPVLLSPGHSADLLVVAPNGYGGYPPSDPKCQHPVTYAHLSAVLEDGSAISLGSTQIVVDCEGPIQESPWSATP